MVISEGHYYYCMYICTYTAHCLQFAWAAGFNLGGPVSTGCHDEFHQTRLEMVTRIFSPPTRASCTDLTSKHGIQKFIEIFKSLS